MNIDSLLSTHTKHKQAIIELVLSPTKILKLGLESHNVSHATDMTNSNIIRVKRTILKLEVLQKYFEMYVLYETAHLLIF